MGPGGWLRERKVRELVRGKRRLVEVPYNATVADTLHVLVANSVVSVPVAAPPGRWIGAGGSVIVELDPATGDPRKHYIGMVTTLDILAHIADEHGNVGGDVDLHRKMSVAVASIIGHSLEGLSLWTLNPNTSVMDCMETFSKGVHRALVPVETTGLSDGSSATLVELSETAPGYRMLTQIDVVRFLMTSNSGKLNRILHRSVVDLGAVKENVFAIGRCTTVIEAIRWMRTTSLSAVPVVDNDVRHVGGANDREDLLLLNGKGRKLVGTFSATDLRGCSIDVLQSYLSATVSEFSETLWLDSAMAGDGSERRRRRPGELVTCAADTSLGEVMEAAVAAHVHRVWVVGNGGTLEGLVSLTDVLRVVREAAELPEED